MIEMNESQVEEETKTIVRELHWQLHTLIATAVSYLVFIILLLASVEHRPIIYYAFGPLILYDILKIAACGRHIYKGYDTEMKGDVKDIIECALMIPYKVNKF